MSKETPQESPEMTPTLAKKLVKNVNEIEEQIKNDFEQIKKSGQNIEDKVVTVLLGPTGSGKTTLYYALTGKQLKPSRMGSERILNASTPEKNFKIGHSGLSETHIPGIEYDSETDMIFCDCPGFFDNRGEIQDITNSFAICRVLGQAKNIKILLLMSHQDIKSAKGRSLRDCCQLVEQLIPDKQSLQPAISLVITHISQDAIDDANDPENDDSGILSNVELGRTGWILKYFRDNEMKNKKVVFTFPQPTKQEMQSHEYNGFDRQPILDFIRKGKPTPIVPFVALSTEAKLMLLSVIDSFGTLSKILQEFVLRLQMSSTQSDDDLDTWKDRIEEFEKSSYPSPKDLVDKARELVNPTTPLYESIYDSLMKIHNWRSFLELIVKDELSSNDQVLYRESPLLSSVFLDITEYFVKMLPALHSIIIEKIKKREIEKEKDAAFEEMKAAKEREDKAIKERNEQIELIAQKDYEMKLLAEQQKNEIEKYKMQIELEKQKAALIAQSQPKQDNGPAYITALAPILTALITKK